MEQLAPLLNVFGWLILACLFITLGLTIERVRCLRSASIRPRPFLDEVREHLRAGDLRAALERTAATGDAAIGRVVQAGLDRASQPLGSARAAVHAASLEQTQRLSRRLSVLTTIGVIALSLGVLGTFFDLLPAFVNIADAPSDTRAARNVAEAGHSLGSTGLGLAVAVVALTARAMLGAWVRKIEAQLEHASVMILNLVRDVS